MSSSSVPAEPLFTSIKLKPTKHRLYDTSTDSSTQNHSTRISSTGSEHSTAASASDESPRASQPVEERLVIIEKTTTSDGKDDSGSSVFSSASTSNTSSPSEKVETKSVAGNIAEDSSLLTVDVSEDTPVITMTNHIIPDSSQPKPIVQSSVAVNQPKDDAPKQNLPRNQQNRAVSLTDIPQKAPSAVKREEPDEIDSVKIKNLTQSSSSSNNSSLKGGNKVLTNGNSFDNRNQSNYLNKKSTTEVPGSKKELRTAPNVKATNRDSASKETANRNSPNKETTDRESPSKETTDRDFSNKELSNQNSANKQTTNKSHSSNEVTNKRSINSQVTNQHNSAKVDNGSTPKASSTTETNLTNHSKAQGSPTNHSKAQGSPTNHSKAQGSPTNHSKAQCSPTNNNTSHNAALKTTSEISSSSAIVQPNKPITAKSLSDIPKPSRKAAAANSPAEENDLQVSNICR